MRAYCVVPLWADFVASELDRLEFRFGNLDSRFAFLQSLGMSNAIWIVSGLILLAQPYSVQLTVKNITNMLRSLPEVYVFFARHIWGAKSMSLAAKIHIF